MQLIKEKYRSVGKDMNIKIPLGANANLSGLQDSINDFVFKETALSINPVTDGETFRFKSTVDRTIRSYFRNNSNVLGETLLNAGFTQQEITDKADVVTNSFYLVQVYNSIVNENQIILHNSYYNGTSINSTSTSIQMKIDNEFSNFYIPEWFINDNDDGSGIINVFVKFMFYNAKTGKLQVFYNRFKESNTTEDKIYFDATLLVGSKTYSIETADLRFNEFIVSSYTNKVNQSVGTIKNEKPTFPNGNKFTRDGKYETII